MPCIIKEKLNGKLQNFAELAPKEWRLREQVETLESWLSIEPLQLDPTHDWIADIGFCVRADAKGGGPPITKNLMKLCLDANLEIYLSEYPGEASSRQE